MGQQLRIEGREIDPEPGMTVAELKQKHDIPDDDIATYIDDTGEIVAVSDHDVLEQVVPPGTNLSFQPAKGTVFGRR